MDSAIFFWLGFGDHLLKPPLTLLSGSTEKKTEGIDFIAKMLKTSTSTLSYLCSIGIFKAFAMQFFLESYRRLFDETYCHPHCLLRLVNETAPTHFAAHRFWSTLEYGDCPDLAGMVLNQVRNVGADLLFSYRVFHVYLLGDQSQA